MNVITRFAPSPTGALHVGGARTALYNYLFARKMGGKFLLRIEDTDRERSTEAACQVILDSLAWLNLEYDGKPIYQSTRVERHQEVAHELVKRGMAYYCYAQPEEIAATREQARQNKQSFHFQSPWRDGKKDPIPGMEPVVRLKTPEEGATKIRDIIQGEVTVSNKEIDDMVLLRSDGTPTYMLAVVVDDHDMEVTHIIRGDDHLTNAFRQYHIYQGMGWQVPEFAHIPLIHGEDGAKLSKRHGAASVTDFREMGILREALANYLILLGWGHESEELFSFEQAIKLFELHKVNKNPARFDQQKLLYINSHYIGELAAEMLIAEIEYFTGKISEPYHSRLSKGLVGLKARGKTIKEIAEIGRFYLCEAKELKLDQLDSKSEEVLAKLDKQLFTKLVDFLATITKWEEEEISNQVKSFLNEQGAKLGAIGPAVRVALTGSSEAPGVFEILYALGKDEALDRMRKIL